MRYYAPPSGDDRDEEVLSHQLSISKSKVGVPILNKGYEVSLGDKVEGNLRGCE